MSLPPINTLLNSAFLSSISDLRDRIPSVSQEAVTGRYEDLVVQLDGRIDKALVSEKALADINTSREQLNLRATRLDIVQSALTGVDGAIGDLPTQLLSAVGFEDQRAISTAAQDAAFALDEIFSTLSTRHGERFLFSGDATSSRPFPDAETVITDVRQIALAAVDEADFQAQLDAYFEDPAGPYQQNIYAGAATSSDPDGVVGIDPALVQVVSALSVIAIGDLQGAPQIISNATTTLQTAATHLSNGQVNLTALRSDQGFRQEEIDRSLQRLESEETVLTAAFNSLTARDQFEAAVELRDLQTNLEVAFLLTERLSSLSLVNFLR